MRSTSIRARNWDESASLESAVLAAVMNAIHNATGARVRDFPATLDKLLAALEALD